MAALISTIESLSSNLTAGYALLTSKVQSFTDRVFPSEKRASVKARLVSFTREYPLVASFLFCQIAFSAIPILLFVLLTVGVFLFALAAALLVALLCTLLFTLFCVGLALLVLLPTLFVTTFSAVSLWMWGWGAYGLLRWLGKLDTAGALGSKVFGPGASAEDGSSNGAHAQGKGEANGSRGAKAQDSQTQSQGTGNANGSTSDMEANEKSSLATATGLDQKHVSDRDLKQSTKASNGVGSLADIKNPGIPSL